MNRAEEFRYHLRTGTLTGVLKVRELLDRVDLDPAVRDDAEVYLKRVAVPVWE